MRRTQTSVRPPLIPTRQKVRPGIDNNGGGEIPGDEVEDGRVLSPKAVGSKTMLLHSIQML